MRLQQIGKTARTSPGVGSRGRGIQQKLMLFLGVYSLVLIVCVLGLSVANGFTDLHNGAKERLFDKADLLNHSLDDNMRSVNAELRGLAARLEHALYNETSFWNAHTQKIILDFLAVDPYAFSKISVGNVETQEVTTVQQVLELGEIQPWVQHARDQKPLGEVLKQVNQTPETEHLEFQVVARPELDTISILMPLPLRRDVFLVAGLRLSSLLSKVVARVDTDASMEIIVADQRGIVLFSTDMSRLRKLIGRDFPFLAQFRNMDFQESSFFPSFGSLTLLRPMRDLPLVMVLHKDLADDLVSFRTRILTVLLFSCLLALIAFGFARLLSGRLSTSVQEMTRVARKVAAGDFRERIPFRRNDEIGVLIDTFNDMIGDLSSSYDALRDVNRELERRLEELKRTRQELSRKQRLALLGDAISKISHEIQNKIGGVSIWAQNLERLAPDHEKVRMCVSEIKSSISEFTHMLADFKLFYREPQLQMGSFALKNLLEKLSLQVTSELTPRKVRLRHAVHDPDMLVQGDERQLLDVLVNLVVNAIYYSKDGGEIVLGSRLEEEQLVLSVCDRGPGVSPDDLAHLVQPFTSTKPTGSGLGLAIAYTIVTAHKGKLTCVQRKSGGTCFQIWLPLADKTELKSGDPNENPSC